MEGTGLSVACDRVTVMTNRVSPPSLTAPTFRECLHGRVPYSVAFAPEGRTALAGSSGATLRRWEVATGKELRSFTGYYPVAFSPDGRTALSGSSDATLRLWEVATGKQLRTFTGTLGSIHSVA